MVGIIVVSHGLFAEEALKSAAMLVGHGERIATEGVHEGDTPESFYQRVQAIAAQVDDGGGIVALVDIFGGTPNNTVYQLKRERNVRIVTGFNLPMLLYAITERTESTTLDELAEHFFINKYYMLHEFKQYTCTSVYGYIQSKRVINAKTLMQAGVSPGEACRMSGFGDYSSFYKTFMRYVGTPPMSYMKKQRRP